MTDLCNNCALRDIADAALEQIGDKNGKSIPSTGLKRNAKVSFEVSGKRIVFGVCSGILGRQHLLSDGRRSITELFMKGDIIKSEYVPRNTEIIALTQCKLVSFDAKELETLRHSSIKADNAFQKCVANQHCILAEHCSDISKKTPPERLASFLIEFSSRDEGVNQTHIDLNLLGKDIGEYLALETETVSRSYSKLRDVGILSFDKPNHIEIMDRKRLQQIADGGMPRKRKQATS